MEQGYFSVPIKPSELHDSSNWTNPHVENGLPVIEQSIRHLESKHPNCTRLTVWDDESAEPLGLNLQKLAKSSSFVEGELSPVLLIVDTGRFHTLLELTIGRTGWEIVEATNYDGQLPREMSTRIPDLFSMVSSDEPYRQTNLALARREYLNELGSQGQDDRIWPHHIFAGDVLMVRKMQLGKVRQISVLVEKEPKRPTLKDRLRNLRNNFTPIRGADAFCRKVSKKKYSTF